MVHEDVFGTHDPVTGSAHADRVVVVLELADPELLVERADPLEDVASHRDAEHRGDADVGYLPAETMPALGRERSELAVGSVGRRHPGFVGCRVRDRSDEPDILVVEVANEAHEPIGRDDHVVVQHDEHATRRELESAVYRGGESLVLRIEHEPQARKLAGHGFQVGDRLRRGAVVDHDDLEACELGVGKDALDRHTHEGELTERDDDHRCRVTRPQCDGGAVAGSRMRPREHALDGAGFEAEGSLRRRREHEIVGQGHLCGEQTVTPARRRQADVLEYRLQDAVVGEELLRDVTRRLAVTCVVGVDRLDRRPGLVERRRTANSPRPWEARCRIRFPG